MLYAVLCYNSEDVVCSWSKEEDDAVMAQLGRVQEKLAKAGKLGPVARLMPTTAATTLRKDPSRRWSSTGRSPRPRSSCSASTWSTCETLDEALEFARELAQGQSRRRVRDPPAAGVPSR